ncbi:MAG: cytochrome c3 family protein [Candidatus Zixiibacteriota bacterium]
MSQQFPQWTNRLPVYLAVAGIGALVIVVGFFWHFGSPRYTDVGYRPRQPVEYSHKLHAGDLGLDCRYCHYNVEVSAKAGVPPTKVCMNCHTLIGTQSEKLLAVRESWSSGKPLQWVRVHDLPDYVYFDHSIHLHAGIGCESCHGNVAQMERVMQKKPQSMGWCLDCHRHPDDQLRRPQEITTMGWTRPADQAEYAARVKVEKKIAPSEDCSACHR